MSGTAGKQDAMGLARLAQEHETAGRSREMLSIGQQIVKLKPQWAPGHYFVGAAQCDLGMLDESERNLKKAIARDGTQFAMYTKLGETLNRLGHRDEPMRGSC